MAEPIFENRIDLTTLNQAVLNITDEIESWIFIFL